jgi:UDP-N-acetylglucosamine 4,6-dehydratase/5-epimerase
MLRDLDEKAAAIIAGKVVLVTGAAGTVGRALTSRLLSFNPRAIRLLDHNEEESFHLSLLYGSKENVRILLGDIRDRERMKRAIQGVDLVFHAAALKHVGLGEYNPFEVVRTNLVALQDLIECCIDANVEKFIFTSSDKAVNPTNVMGGSKFIGERLVTAGNHYRGRARTIFSSTRFGNVLGSAGSVIPIFRKQILAGGPVTVTHRDMTRFIMTPRQAVDLILSGLTASLGGEVFVPKMETIRIMDLATGMIELLANGRPVTTEVVGLRSGEKMFEELISEDEVPRCLETDRLMFILPFDGIGAFDDQERAVSTLKPSDYPDSPRWAQGVYSSRTSTPISRASVVELLRSELSQDPP